MLSRQSGILRRPEGPLRGGGSAVRHMNGGLAGGEPTVPLRAHTLSRRASSTTPASLRRLPHSKNRKTMAENQCDEGCRFLESALDANLLHHCRELKFVRNTAILNRRRSLGRVREWFEPEAHPPLAENRPALYSFITWARRCTGLMFFGPASFRSATEDRATIQRDAGANTIQGRADSLVAGNRGR
jgi:hypothetical protein